MSLNCWWPDNLDNEELNKNGFSAGMLLMTIGMSEISTDNIDEIKFRAEVCRHVYGGSFITFDLNKWVGLRTNVHNETRRTWLERVKRGVKFRAGTIANRSDKKAAVNDAVNKFKSIVETALVTV